MAGTSGVCAVESQTNGLSRLHVVLPFHRGNVDESMLVRCSDATGWNDCVDSGAFGLNDEEESGPGRACVPGSRLSATKLPPIEGRTDPALVLTTLVVEYSLPSDAGF